MTQHTITNWTQIAHLLATKRHHDNRTQTDIATKLHKPTSLISYWENGKRTPQPDDLIAWCKESGFDLILVKRTESPISNRTPI